ncbi:MAG: hypothetical protein NUV84_04260, partial [Candidatus Uhrbacteria bacterium]|nr:hypothetical protein [Candidatus Uhrbacteria bacterium]
VCLFHVSWCELSHGPVHHPGEFQMLESLYNVILFALAIVGALRAGAWITRRDWQWYWKVVAGLVVASAIGDFLHQLGGGPKSDLRIVTEVLASVGAIFALEFAFRRVADNRWRAVFVALAGVFLFVTWTESVDRAMGTVKAVAPAAISAPAATFVPTPAATSTRSPSGVDPMCGNPHTTYEQYLILPCPPD